MHRGNGKIKVAMVISHASASVGGMQKQALCLASELQSMGLSVSVLSKRDKGVHRNGAPSQETDGEVKFVPLPFTEVQPAWSFLFSFLSWACFNRHSFEIIHAHNTSLGMISSLVGRLFRKKVVVKIPGMNGMRWLNGDTIPRRLRRWILARMADRFVAVSTEAIGPLRQAGIAPEKIVLIPNGVQLNEVPQGLSRAALKKDLIGETDSQVILFVGRLVREKGLERLLNVWASLPHRRQRVLLIIGDGPLRAALEAQAEALGLSPSVRFLGHQPEAIRYYPIADLFVLPSITEGMSNALLEAMAAGVPAIASDAGGNKEVIEDRKSGFLVDWDRTSECAQLLADLLSDVELRQTIGQAARARARAFSMEEVAQRYIHLYRSMLEEASPRAEQPDVAIFFGRPGRSEILAEKLKARGFPVSLYNDRGLAAKYSPVPHSFFPAFFRLLSTRHKIYLTATGFIPSLCLYLNRLLRRSLYILNATGLKSATYKERAEQWPLSGLAERWIYPALMRLSFAGASRIVCNSQYLQRELAARFPRYARKMTTIYNGIEFEKYGSARPASAERPAPRLLAVMTWNYAAKASAAKLLIDAMGPVLEKFPAARLTIAAKASHHGHGREIERYLARVPWRNSIDILYNQNNIPELLAGSDLFVYSTPAESNDSLPRALLEAHAAGLPIVATATAGCPEVVEDGVSGHVVPYKAGAMAERIVALLADPAKRQEMGRRGRERVLRVFSWDNMAEGYARLFLELLSKGPASSGQRVLRESKNTSEIKALDNVRPGP